MADDDDESARETGCRMNCMGRGETQFVFHCVSVYDSKPTVEKENVKMCVDGEMLDDGACVSE